MWVELVVLKLAREKRRLLIFSFTMILSYFLKKVMKK